MTHSLKTRASLLSTALFMGLCAWLPARAAHASPNFPPLLQAALEEQFPTTSFCVPLCSACHLTTAGGPFNYNVFGANLLANGLGAAHPDFLVANALKAELAKNLDSDGDGKTDSEELQVGDSPSVPGERGVGTFCSDIKYGCGARIASAPPPVDRLGLFSAGLVALGLAALRRRRRPQSAR
jgi:hypothetical protein